MEVLKSKLAEKEESNKKYEREVAQLRQKEASYVSKINEINIDIKVIPDV